MKVILIYDIGDKYNADIRFEEFEDKHKMIEFVNKEDLGNEVISCYEIGNKIEIEPYDKVLEYRLKG